MTRILITGSHGFVGRAFRRHYSNEPCELYLVDLKTGQDCRRFFRVCERRFDLVIHLAAIVGGRMTIENDPLSVASDLAIDSDFFNWTVRTKQPRVVYFSSSAAYPIHLQAINKEIKLRESDIDLEDTNIGLPDMSYGWTKLTGELLAEYARAQGVNVHVLRPFSGYGNDQDLDYPFPSFIERAVKRLDPFPIWGTGMQTRDFIHIDDVVAATIKIVNDDVQMPVNLCTGRSTSFNQLAQLVNKQAGHRPRLEHHRDRPMGVMNRVGDPTFMKRFYEPKVSLEEGIERALTEK